MEPRASKACQHTDRQSSSGRLWLIDIENLCGYRRGRHLEPWELQLTVRQLRHLIWPTSNDYVVVACDESMAKTVKVVIPSHQILTGRGKDGADKAILRFLHDPAVVSNLFSEVVIVGGDGIYAELARRLRDCGLDVGVVSRSASLSSRLRASATWTQCLRGRTGGTNLPKRIIRLEETVTPEASSPPSDTRAADLKVHAR